MPKVKHLFLEMNLSTLSCIYLVAFPLRTTASELSSKSLADHLVQAYAQTSREEQGQALRVKSENFVSLDCPGKRCLSHRMFGLPTQELAGTLCFND